MSTQPAGSASTAIVRDTVRDGLRSATSDSGFEFSDPLGSNRDADTEFVLTSFPDRDAQYPHVVVLEAGDSRSRPDSRVDLQSGPFDVRVECYGRSSTESMNLRDDIREWFQGSYATFRDAGWTEVELVSSTAISHESDVSSEAFQLTYSGTLYTTT